MGKKYYVVFIGWDGEVSYGVDNAFYLAQICETKEDAKAYIESPACKERVKEIREKYDLNGDYGEIEVFYSEFSNHNETVFIGGACYLE